MDLFNNANPKKEDKKNMSSEAMPIGVGYKNTLQLFIQKCTLNFIVQKDIDDLFVSMTSLEQVIKDKNIYQPFIIIIKKWIEKWQLEIKRARVHKYVYPLKQNHKDFMSIKEEEDYIKKNSEYIQKYFYTKDITIKNISKILDMMLIQKADFDSDYDDLDSNYFVREANLEKYIAEFLKNIFGDIVNTQYSVGGKPRMMIDFDFGNGILGIELKVANELDKSEKIHRFVGQGIYYSKRVYNKQNFIAFVVGQDRENYIISELRTIFESLNITFIYKEAI